MIRDLPARGGRADRHGGQGHQERDVHPLAVRPALARPADDPHVVPDLPRRQARRLDLAGGDRRVRTRRDDLRLGPGLLPGAARERRNAHPAAADRRGVEGHRLRLGPGQGDGPARRRPVGGRQGAGRAGGRGDRGDRPLHRTRRRSSAGPAAGPWSRSPSRSRTCGSTSPRRDLDDREPAPGPRPGPGDRGGQDHRDRPARGGRPGRPLRPGDRRPHAGRP